MAKGSARLLAFVKAVWLFGVLCLPNMPSFGLDRERGRPPVQIWDTQLLGGADGNLGVDLLSDGRILLSNVNGLLRFDGQRWLFQTHPQKLTLRQRVKLEGTKYWAVFFGDFGYFEEDARGQLEWHSQLKSLPLAEGTEVLDYARSPDGSAWILTNQELLRIDHTRPMRMPFENGYRIEPLGASALAVNQLKVGLVVVREVAGQIAIDPPEGIDALRAWNFHGPTCFAMRCLIGLVDGRLFTYQPHRIEHFSTTLVDLAQSQQRELNISSLLALKDALLAVGTVSGQLCLVQQSGAIEDCYGNTDGLPERRIVSIAEDAQGGVWLTMNGYVLRIDLRSALTQFDAALGLPGARTITRWNGELMVVGAEKLFRLVPQPLGPAQWQALNGLRAATAARAFDQHTLLISHAGLWTLDSKQPSAPKVLSAMGQSNLLLRSRFTDRAWLSSAVTPLVQLERGSKEGLEVSTIALKPSMAMAESDAKSLWVGNQAGDLWQVNILSRTVQKHYPNGSVLPPGQVKPYPRPGNGVWFATSKGLYTFDAELHTFVQPDALPAELKERPIFSMLEDFEGHIWVRGTNLNGVAWRTPDGYRFDQEPLHEVPSTYTTYEFLREDKMLWIVRANGLLRIDLSKHKSAPPPPPPRVVEIIDLARQSALPLDILAGAETQHSSLRLNFALHDFHRADASFFRSQLVGVDAQASAWSREAFRDYTGLRPGRYRFELEAMDGHGRIHRMSPGVISIPLPWWHSTWAYTLYVGLLLGALRLSAFLGARRKLKQHLARQAELERRVEERTIELQHKSQLLAEQAEQLKALDRLKTQFFVNVGHEFRTPLTLVLGPLDDVLDDPRAKVTDKLRNLLELARRNAKRVLQLIIELLDVNRLEHGQMPLRYASYCCQDFLNQHLPSWRAWCERYGHTLILEAQSEPREAAFDAAQLERAIGNLLSNACKYTPHGGTIRLQSDAPSGYWRISVRDSGPGIEPNALPYVFDRFFQTTPEHRTEGSGIGLNLVREIAERHGGQATVESELGVGCIFRVWIPLAGAPAPAISEPDTEPLPAANGERPVVLVVDDHDDMRARLRQLCEARYQVIEAHDGPSALMRASTELPDAVISDVMMPGFDGVDFVKRMRANPSTESIPILLLTAKVGSEHARVGLDAGANDYLAKPFDSSELLARIAAMLQFCRRLKQRLATSVALSPEPQGREEQWLRRFNHLLQKSLPEPSFSIEQLSDALHMDRSTLFRRIKEEYGMSPTEYLREQRLLRARELLSQQQGGVLEVSLAVGYENHSNFARAFKQRFGHPPSDLLLKRRRES